MPEITLTIKIQVDGGAFQAVDVVPDDEAEDQPNSGFAAFERRVLGSADATHRPHMETYLAEATRRGARRLPPSTGSRPYINFMPPIGRLDKRVSALAPSGRLAVFVDPAHADEFEHAEVVLNSKVPAYVKVYLDSAAALSDALALTDLALGQR